MFSCAVMEDIMSEYIKREILPHFKTDAKVKKISVFDSGHINNTFYLVTNNGGYVLQQINHNVFKKPEQVMSNIMKVTEHLKNKIKEKGGNTERETLNFIPADNGEYYYKTALGEYYRMYKFIGDVRTYQIVEKPEHFYNAAKAFGKFQNMLSDFPADCLYETIENFHHTPLRYAAFEKAVKEDKMGRAESVKGYIDFAMERKKDADVLVEAIASGSIPIRVTHNDTKLNNVLIDNKTNEGICVIDLDTVMPGSMLYDFGDSIRFGTNPASEDEADLSKVNMDMNLFKEYTKGYLTELKDKITPKELKLMPMSAKIMTLECGIRFLTDYLEGDTYFKIEYEKQNLNRTGTQFKLVHDMEKNMDEMKHIIDDILNQ